MKKGQSKKPDSEAKTKAKAMLPENLWPILDERCRDYAFCADTLHGHPFISPRVIAQLILMGWRCSSEPINRQEDIS